MKVRVVADDFKGYGKQTKYVGRKGKIIGWEKNPNRTDDGKLPIIQLDSGEVICSLKIWWEKVKQK